MSFWITNICLYPSVHQYLLLVRAQWLFSLFLVSGRIDLQGQAKKKTKKLCLLMRIMMMRSWTACVGIRVGMFVLRAVFFVFARAHRFAHWTRTRNREIKHCARSGSGTMASLQSLMHWYCEFCHLLHVLWFAGFRQKTKSIKIWMLGKRSGQSWWKRWELKNSAGAEGGIRNNGPARTQRVFQKSQLILDVVVMVFHGVAHDVSGCHRAADYCKRRNFRREFNFVAFV